MACLAGGACLPRGLLEAYARARVPELCHDEIRIPLFARAHGYDLVDTGLRRGWPHHQVDDAFTLGEPVPPSLIEAELDDPSGRRVFHPVRTTWRGRDVRGAASSGTRRFGRWYDAVSGLTPSLMLAAELPWA
jgi:hypothetical protein